MTTTSNDWLCTASAMSPSMRVIRSDRPAWRTDIRAHIESRSGRCRCRRTGPRETPWLSASGGSPCRTRLPARSRPRSVSPRHSAGREGSCAPPAHSPRRWPARRPGQTPRCALGTERRPRSGSPPEHGDSRPWRACAQLNVIRPDTGDETDLPGSRYEGRQTETRLPSASSRPKL